MKMSVYQEARRKALELYEKAHIVLTQEEKDRLEVADFGLDRLYATGLQIITYVNTERCCAKEMALFPGQTCPEHRHAPIDELGYPGKEETFRCRYGVCYVYVDGDPTPDPACQPPKGDEAWYTARRQVVLRPGDQFTMRPDTRHWFQAGPEGAVVSEFSTKSLDAYDIFTDPNIRRIPTLDDEGLS